MDGEWHNFAHHGGQEEGFHSGQIPPPYAYLGVPKLPSSQWNTTEMEGEDCPSGSWFTCRSTSGDLQRDTEMVTARVGQTWVSSEGGHWCPGQVPMYGDSWRHHSSIHLEGSSQHIWMSRRGAWSPGSSMSHTPHQKKGIVSLNATETRGKGCCL